MKRLTFVAVLFSSMLGACDKRPTAPPIVAPTHRSVALAIDPATDTNTYALTPNGYYDKSCVNLLPSGARLSGRGQVTLANGATYLLPPCAHPGRIPASIARPPVFLPGHLGVYPDTGGWAVSEHATESGSTLRHLSARWVVPQVPLTSYSHPDTVQYWFPGMQNGHSILQPVMQYGNDGHHGGAYWTVSPWICGAHCESTVTVPNVNVGDVIKGRVDATSCSGGYCSWQVTVVDSTLGDGDSLYVDASYYYYNGETSDAFTDAVGGALEWYRLNSCSQLSGGQHIFSQLVFTDSSGSTFSPLWYESLGGRALNCEYGGTYSSSSVVTLTDSLAKVFGAAISGPTSVQSGSGGLWDSSTGLGTSPFTYLWSGILSGTSASISGDPSSSGTLYLRVIDAAADTAFDSLYVTVCPPGPPC